MTEWEMGWIEFLPKSKNTHLIGQVQLPSAVEVENCVEGTRMSGRIHHHPPHHQHCPQHHHPHQHFLHHHKHSVPPVKEELIVNKRVIWAELQDVIVSGCLGRYNSTYCADMIQYNSHILRPIYNLQLTTYWVVDIVHIFCFQLTVWQWHSPWKEGQAWRVEPVPAFSRAPRVWKHSRKKPPSKWANEQKDHLTPPTLSVTLLFSCRDFEMMKGSGIGW